jgi:23S rRNA (cytosine1962-C5)-methyltransferase
MMISALFFVSALMAEPGASFLPQKYSTASSFKQSRSAIFVLPAVPDKDKKRSEQMTLKELMNDIEKNPAAYQQQPQLSKKKKRTRKRVDSPQQQYIYAAQRRQLNATSETTVDEFSPIYQARQLGLTNPAGQHCDAPVAAVEPEILGRVQVADDDTKPSSFAYIIQKPAGWAILGGDGGKNAAAQISQEGDHENDFEDHEVTQVELELDERPDDKLSVTIQDDATGKLETIEWYEQHMLAVMTPEEIAELESEGGIGSRGNRSKRVGQREASLPVRTEQASFEPYSRPSVLSWFKELMTDEGTPVRGGKYWTALAGATQVDDSGLVLLCPKDKVNNLFVDFTKYVAVIGNGKFMAAKPKSFGEIPKKSIEMEILAKLRRGRDDDVVITVGLAVVEHASNSNQIVQACQNQLLDGIRGDPAANPFDRRAPRRLIHCDAMSVSSLSHDDVAEVDSEFLPDDIALFADRRNNHAYSEGSFLGRSELGGNPYTNAYREINGAADGFPGWIIDRYDEWLVVQHDDRHPRGPLPSIHDGNTAGVYYLPATPSRSMMGRQDIRPILLEGRPAPEMVPIQENGVIYLTSLDKDLSTGIFLDQRPQRAWLTRNCNHNTRVLNCFAHCGAFSIAAASAGASTVSLDLNKKFLDRVAPQLEVNDIAVNERHDCIYGDCFDWLARLAKRGEQFDLIILDPPSTSVGIKKKRWSIKSDMAELVALAAPMVKKGGLLWTTTNSASVHPVKFAKMCKAGLDEVGLRNAKLERIVPMPLDFPSVGPPTVKNLVWRIP